jgi:anthranilate synthase/aminodeoxychorismate synthase-like glutamine amidotransferase
MILLIDNYDSFVHNLARYLRRLGVETRVVRNDAVNVAAARKLQPQAIVISPGPCTPAEAGCSVDLVRSLGNETPLLGVCLGHQAIGEAFGGRTVRAPHPMHGRASTIQHCGLGIFSHLPTPLTVGRYHSLVIERSSLPAELQITAESSDGLIMGVAHRQWPVWGVQFHPESILTDGGYRLLANFLDLAGVARTQSLPNFAEENPRAIEAYEPPVRPVTF